MTMRGNAAETYLALLHGINVGGKNVIRMRDLTPLHPTRGANPMQTAMSASQRRTMTGVNHTRDGGERPSFAAGPPSAKLVLDNEPPSSSDGLAGLYRIS